MWVSATKVIYRVWNTTFDRYSAFATFPSRSRKKLQGKLKLIRQVCHLLPFLYVIFIQVKGKSKNPDLYSDSRLKLCFNAYSERSPLKYGEICRGKRRKIGALIKRLSSRKLQNIRALITWTSRYSCYYRVHQATIFKGSKIPYLIINFSVEQTSLCFHLSDR